MCSAAAGFLAAVHCSLPQAEAGQQLREQAEKTARAAQRAEKLRKQLAARGSGGAAGLPAGAAGPADVEADVQVGARSPSERVTLPVRGLAASHRAACCWCSWTRRVWATLLLAIYEKPATPA